MQRRRERQSSGKWYPIPNFSSLFLPVPLSLFRYCSKSRGPDGPSKPRKGAECKCGRLLRLIPFLPFVLEWTKLYRGLRVGWGLPCYILCLTTGFVVPATALVRGILSSLVPPSMTPHGTAQTADSQIFLCPENIWYIEFVCFGSWMVVSLGADFRWYEICTAKWLG